jgi:hypothetical protein
MTVFREDRRAFHRQSMLGGKFGDDRYSVCNVVAVVNGIGTAKFT